MPRPRFLNRFEFAVLLIAAFLSVHGAWQGRQGDHAYSRLATVYSLAKHGTWFIDRPIDEAPNPFEQLTIDKVVVRGEFHDGVVSGGRLISSKPPILPLIMTGEYIVLNRLIGWDLDRERDTDRIVFVMTLSLISASYILTLVYFLRALYLLSITPVARGVLLFACAFGTQLWGFSVSINNHLPAAAALSIVVYYYIGFGLSEKRSEDKNVPRPDAIRLGVFGFACTLVPLFDMPVGVYAFLCGCAVAVRIRSPKLVWMVLAGAVPLALHFGVMASVTGSLLPVQARDATYFFEDSYWRHPLGIDGLSEPKGTYLFHITFGRCGVFLLYPILLIGVAGFISALLRPETEFRGAILLGGIGFLTLTTYYVLKTSNYGGESYGFRWFLASMPVLLLMGAPIVSGLRSRVLQSLLAVGLVVSCYSGWECSQVLWHSGQEWTTRLFGAAYQQVDPD